MKRARGVEKTRRLSQARAWVLSELALRVVLICFSLADGVPGPAVVFLTREGRRRRWADKTDDELGMMVFDSFLAAESAYAMALCDFDNPHDGLALSTAVSWVEEWRAASWCMEQNHKGIAPSSAAVLDYMEARRLSIPESVQPSPRGVITSGAVRRAISRWRQRWSGRVARLRPQEVVPLADMQSKASVSHRTSTPPSPPAPCHTRMLVVESSLRRE